MVMIGFKTLATLALLPAAAFSEVIFYNDGSLNGDWSQVTEEHNGRVREVDNVFYKGPTALKMEQTFDESYTGRYHSEVNVDHGYQLHEERFYGFAFRLSESWEVVDQGYNIGQFIANRVDSGCGDDWMPTTMIAVRGTGLYTRIVSGNYRYPDCTRSITGSPSNIATITPGQWHRIILQAKWETDDTGFFRIWLDDEMVWEKTDLPTTVSGDDVFEFRAGLYANGWYDDDGMEGSQPFRQVWYDEISIGTTYADVDPAQKS